MPRLSLAFKLLILMVVTVSLKGCIGTATVVGAAAGALAVQKTIRVQNIELANQGDAAAQAKVGTSYCCAGPGFSTQKATEWYCKAARQDYVPAFYALGRIYMGEVTRVPHPGLFIAAEATSKKNLAVALMWLQLAVEGGSKGASRKIKTLEFNYKDARPLFDRAYAQATAKMANWRSQPCEYNKVFA